MRRYAEHGGWERVDVDRIAPLHRAEELRSGGSETDHHELVTAFLDDDVEMDHSVLVLEARALARKEVAFTRQRRDLPGATGQRASSGRQVHAAAEDEQERRAMAKRLSKTNRDILVAAFPGIVSPPRPILSKQLILAFVVLGVFPLVVRKIMQRF